VFTPIPTTVNVISNTLTANGISTFSDWTAFGNLVPTAANVNVSGRVTSSPGVGVPDARVTFTDSEGSVLAAKTNTFGFYTIENVPSGRSYLADVKARRYTYESRVINVTDTIHDADFEPIP